MQKRKVEIDFAEGTARWNTRSPEFGYFCNAASSMLPWFEPFLCKIAREARELLPETKSALRTDADSFVFQEGRHFKLHNRFNKLLYEAGYEFPEAKMVSDYKRFHKKGLKFCLAYGLGFETMAPLLTKYAFDHLEDLGLGDFETDPVAYLVVWHLAEEFEHRTVVDYLYRELYGGYLYGLYGMWYGLLHLGIYTVRSGFRMLAKDSQSKPFLERVRGQWRYARLIGRVGRVVVPPMILECSRRNWDPASLAPHPRMLKFLDEASDRYGVMA